MNWICITALSIFTSAQAIQIFSAPQDMYVLRRSSLSADLWIRGKEAMTFRWDWKAKKRRRDKAFRLAPMDEVCTRAVSAESFEIFIQRPLSSEKVLYRQPIDSRAKIFTHGHKVRHGNGRLPSRSVLEMDRR